MRPKVFIPVVLMGFLLLGMFVFARKQASSLLNNGSSQPKTETIEEPSASIDARKTATRTQREETGLAAGKANQQPATNDENTPLAQHQAYVEKRIEELTDLAMNADSGSLDTILSELTNRDPQIRKAALEATIQFGSRDAIPKLMDAVSQIDEPKEKADILEAIEFLKLPSATELIAQAGGASAGGKKAMKTRPAIPAPAPLTK
jgi:hypothetical protein